MLMHILAPSTIKALLRAPRARRPKPVRSAGGYNEAVYMSEFLHNLNYQPELRGAWKY